MTRAQVVVGRDDRDVPALLEGSEWLHARRVSVTRAAGEHEALGGTALVAAVALVAEGKADEVLVIGTTNGRGYALLLVAPESR